MSRWYMNNLGEPDLPLLQSMLDAAREDLRVATEMGLVSMARAKRMEVLQYEELIAQRERS